MRKSSIGSNFSSRSTTSSSPSRAAPTETPICWSRLPEPAKHDRSGSSSLTPVDDGGIFLIRACGLRTRSSPTSGVGLGGLVPRPENAVLGGPPFVSSDFRDFRVHGPRVRIDGISAPSRRFVACVPAAVTTVNRRPRRGAIFPAANTAFASVLAVPFEGGTGSAEAPAAARAVTQRAPSQRADSAAITDPAASTLSPPGDPAPPTALTPSDRISTRTRRRTAAAPGTATPAVVYGFGPVGVPRPPARHANTPSRVPRPRPPLVFVTALLLPPHLLRR